MENIYFVYIFLFICILCLFVILYRQKKGFSDYKHSNVFYIHIPKTGGTSISFWLNKKYDPTIQHDNLENLSEYIPKNVITFTVVRNPWDRVVSAYFFLYGEGHGSIPYIDDVFNGNKTPTFEYFVKNLNKLKTNVGWKFDGTTPQVEWLKNGIDIVLRFENLENDFKIIQELTGDYRPLPHLNKSSHENYRDYYTPDTRDIIASIFKEDINKFDYEF